MSALDEFIEKKDKTPLEWGVILLHKAAAEQAAEELHALNEKVKALEAIKELAQKIYDVSEQDGRYGDGSYAIVMRDEYENSALLVKLGEALEK